MAFVDFANAKQPSTAASSTCMEAKSVGVTAWQL